MLKKMRQIIYINRRWISLFIIICLFSFIMTYFFNNVVKLFDSSVYKFIASFNTGRITNILKLITNFGAVKLELIISMLILLILKNKKYGFICLVNLSSILIINYILKLIFSRQRPTEFRIIDALGYSFPSRTFNDKYGFLWFYNLSS